MEQLYSYKGSYPYPLPKNISEYDINDFTLAPPKPSLQPGEVLEWIDGTWSVRGPNASELDFKWQEIRNSRNQLLAETDIKVIRLLEVGQPISSELINYRQALRDITSLQSDPFNINWPTLE